MRAYRPLCFVLVGFGLLAACVSDSGVKSSADAGADSASGGSSSGDATTSETSTSSSSSSSSSGGGDGGQELPNLGCNVAVTHSIFHVNVGSAAFDGQGQLTEWRNLVGPEKGQPEGTVGKISRGTINNLPTVSFENTRNTNQDPLPTRRVRFQNVGKIISGPFALFVVGNHRFDFSPAYDASSVGATYFFSGGQASRLQLMGRYAVASGVNEGFGALFYNDQVIADRVGVYSDTDFLDAQHLYEVIDVIDGQGLSASLYVDGNLMPVTNHATNRAAATGTEIILGASNRTDQMLAGSISEVVLLSQPTPEEVGCIRQRLKTKYGK
ncbi:MAG: hypothetical protein U0174_22860 [Polyangiaceae bacterium]